MQKITVKQAVQVYKAVSMTMSLIRDNDGNFTEPLSNGFENLRRECANNVQPLWEMAEAEAKQQGKNIDDIIEEIGDSDFPHIMPTLSYQELPSKVMPGITDALEPIMQSETVTEDELKKLFTKNGQQKTKDKTK